MNSQNNRFPKQTLCCGEMTLVGSQCDAQKIECHLKCSAKNVQINQQPLKQHIFCRKHRALNSDTIQGSNHDVKFCVCCTASVTKINGPLQVYRVYTVLRMRYLFSVDVMHHWTMIPLEMRPLHCLSRDGNIYSVTENHIPEDS